MWKLNNMSLNNQKVTEEIKGKIKNTQKTQGMQEKQY